LQRIMSSITSRFPTRTILRSSQILSHFQRPQQSQQRKMTTFKLNTGATIPAVGFGTWQDKDAQEEAVSHALKAGFKHIDTAAIYGTEKMAGDEAIPKVDGKMQLEDVSYVDTYKAMEKVFKAGKAKAIGISNFSKAELEKLLKETSVVPAAHQFELHPWLQQKEFTEFHKSKGILVTAYSPFGNQNEIYDSGKNMGKLMDDPVLVEIGKKYDKTGAQIALAWGVTSGHSVIPKSKTPSRIASNLEGDFKLEAADMKKIDGMDKKLRFNDPSGSFGYKFYADLDGKK
ncbi:putative oxidoreductase, partial [Lachnellula suecica]